VCLSRAAPTGKAYAFFDDISRAVSTTAGISVWIQPIPEQRRIRDRGCRLLLCATGKAAGFAERLSQVTERLARARPLRRQGR
jgi:hypothetical protein